jgi:hypothetical protein
MKKKLLLAMFTLCVSIMMIHSAGAVILFGQTINGDATTNVTPPPGFENAWNTVGFLTYVGNPNANKGTAVAIGSSYIMTANHIRGNVGDIFTLNGVDHTLQELTAIGDGTNNATVDIAVWKVSGSLDSWAPLYTNNDEVGKEMMFVGAGAFKGPEVYVNGNLAGWGYSTVATPPTLRWGTNRIDQIDTFRFYGNIDAEFVTTNFDQGQGPNEFQLGSGDSGGVGFIQEGGVWKVASLGFAVSGYYSRVGNDSDRFLGGLYDTRGLYIQTNTASDGSGIYQYIDPLSNPNPIPTQSYMSRVSQSYSPITVLLAPEPSTLSLVFISTLGVLPFLRRRIFHIS